MKRIRYTRSEQDAYELGYRNSRLWDYEGLQREILGNFVARCAAVENRLRWELAPKIEKELIKRNWNAISLASHAECPLPEIQRLLHKEVAGRLALRTIVRVADVLGLTISIGVS